MLYSSRVHPALVPRQEKGSPAIIRNGSVGTASECHGRRGQEGGAAR
jgi:hypothetical protein